MNEQRGRLMRREGRVEEMPESRPDPQGARLTRTLAKPVCRLLGGVALNMLVRNNKFRNTCMIGRVPAVCVSATNVVRVA